VAPEEVRRLPTDNAGEEPNDSALLLFGLDAVNVASPARTAKGGAAGPGGFAP